jgi:transketolase
MAAIIPGGTFLVFADYARPAMRLAALMGIRVIYVMTHDSIGLGEDGPTHQPVEHSRRPARHPQPARLPPGRCHRDRRVLAAGAGSRTTPSDLALTRQNLPAVRTDGDAERKPLRPAAPTNCHRRRRCRGHHLRHRLRGRDRAVRASCSGRAPARVVSVPAGAVRKAQEPRLPRRSSATRRQGRHRGRHRMGWDSWSSAPTASSSACTASAPAPLSKTSTSISASPPEAVVEAAQAAKTDFRAEAPCSASGLSSRSPRRG